MMIENSAASSSSSSDGADPSGVDLKSATGCVSPANACKGYVLNLRDLDKTKVFVFSKSCRNKGPRCSECSKLSYHLGKLNTANENFWNYQYIAAYRYPADEEKKTYPTLIEKIQKSKVGKGVEIFVCEENSITCITKT